MMRSFSSQVRNCDSQILTGVKRKRLRGQACVLKLSETGEDGSAHHDPHREEDIVNIARASLGVIRCSEASGLLAGAVYQPW